MMDNQKGNDISYTKATYQLVAAFGNISAS